MMQVTALKKQTLWLANTANLIALDKVCDGLVS